ncbi:hypothetical protein [Campylobacter sputorum]|uniref:hypothetical protein n=1 Tax=Campylobacter sputorum TaxID=206 RepID=UPI00053BDDBF|nr:hypothetical protein [Campylobacter sputorum]
MTTFDFKEECNKFGYKPINTLLIGNFYHNENCDVYMIYDKNRLEYEKAKQIMDKLYGSKHND